MISVTAFFSNGLRCALYRSRWAIETFFKEIKQTLQSKTFIGYSRNAIEWQLWSAMLTSLLLWDSTRPPVPHKRQIPKPNFSESLPAIPCLSRLQRLVASVAKSYGTAMNQGKSLHSLGHM